MEHSRWHQLLKEQLPEGYFKQINQFLDQVYASGTIYPPREKVFQALKTTNLEEVKVVILGQDPYHGPGQIVGYPILDLDNFFTDIHKYLRFLEEVIIRTLADYGLKAERSEGETGVWLDVGTPFARKICAMGVRCSRWVTMHGFALNVNTDLGYFDNIIPCGIRGKAVTSLNVELAKDKVDIAEVKSHILKHFKEMFEAELI